MARILCIDTGPEALDPVLRWIEAGHQVKWYVPPDPKADAIGKGLVVRCDNWRDWVRWADVVVLSSNTKFLTQLEPYRREGVKIVGPTPAAAAWELDRNAGMKVFEAHGIELPPYREFHDYDRAIAYVKKEERPFVSKPCGDEPDKSLTYVSKSPADMVYMLERWKKAKKLKGSFILQEKVRGIEMAVGGFFGPGGFNQGWLENWEEKKMMVGGLGVATGEQGTTMRYVRRSKLADMVLAPLADTLEEIGYCGYIDVNCIIDDTGHAWPLEFTMRFGWPCFNIQQALFEGDPAQWLVDLAHGRDARPWKLNEIAVGVVLTIPDYPYSHATQKEICGIPVYGISSGNRDQIHPCGLMMGEAPQDVSGKVISMPSMVTANDYVLIASGTGETVQHARRRAYRVLDQISVPNSPMWRTDIGLRLSRQLPELQRMGFASQMRFSDTASSSTSPPSWRSTAPSKS